MQYAIACAKIVQILDLQFHLSYLTLSIANSKGRKWDSFGYPLSFLKSWIYADSNVK